MEICNSDFLHEKGVLRPIEGCRIPIYNGGLILRKNYIIRPDLSGLLFYSAVIIPLTKDSIFHAAPQKSLFIGFRMFYF